MEWLVDNNSVCGGIGEKSLRNAIEDASSIANKSSQNELILNSITTIKSLLNNLCTLTRDGKVNLNFFSF
jgi:hypothetical protein